MYLLKTEMIVGPGVNAELEALATRLGEIRKGRAGYLGQTFLHSYGNPGKYAITSRYQNVEACWDFIKSNEFQSFTKSMPAGLFTAFQQDGYESVFEVDGDGVQDPAVATCEVLVDWTLGAHLGSAAAFEQSRRELFELHKKHAKGFVSSRLRQSAGTPNKYLILQIRTDVEAARAGMAVPELQAFAAAHPASLYTSTPPSVQVYQVVHRA